MLRIVGAGVLIFGANLVFADNKDELCTSSASVASYQLSGIKDYPFSQWSEGGGVQDLEGSVWFGTNDSKVHRFTPGGEWVQSYNVDAGVSGKPTVLAAGPMRGSLVFGTLAGTLYIWEKSLNKIVQLKHPAGGRIVSSPAAFSDGSFVVLNDQGVLRYYRADGSPEIGQDGSPKVVRLGVSTVSAPIVMPDGSVAVPTGDKKIIFVQKDGSKKVYHPGAAISAKPVMNAQGNLVVGGEDGRLHVVRSDATPVVPPTLLVGRLLGSSGVFSNGVSVSSGSAGLVQFVNSDGSKRATYDQGIACSADIVVRGPFAYVGCDDGTLSVFDMNGIKLAEYRSQSEVVGMPLVLKDGTIFFSNLEPRMIVARLAKSTLISMSTVPTQSYCPEGAVSDEGQKSNHTKDIPRLDHLKSFKRSSDL